MKALRFVFVLFVIFATNVSLLADNPQGKQKTIVIRYGAAIASWLWDGDKTLLYVTSEQDWAENVFCNNQPPSFSMHSQVEIIASGKFNSYFKGPLLARLYYPRNLDDFTWTLEQLCSFIRNEQPVAEGIVQFDFHDHNSCAFGPGRNQWYWRLSGSLFNIAAPCPGP